MASSAATACIPTAPCVGRGVASHASGNIGKHTFKAICGSQMSTARKAYGLAGIQTAADFNEFYAALVSEVEPTTQPPSWASKRGSTIHFSGVLVLLCEYASTRDDPTVGDTGIWRACVSSGVAWSAALDVLEAVQTSTKLERRCTMSLVVERFLSGAGANAEIEPDTEVLGKHLTAEDHRWRPMQLAKTKMCAKTFLVANACASAGSEPSSRALARVRDVASVPNVPGVPSVQNVLEHVPNMCSTRAT